jgi:sodium/potassium-transporting ATPase subunit alpha
MKNFQAPDILLRRCSCFVSSDGAVLPLTSQDISRISATQDDFASRGQRVLLLAKKIIPSSELDRRDIDDVNHLEELLIALNDELVVVGLVALVDPPRDDTAETVRICRGAGIRFAMVTGAFCYFRCQLGSI